MLGMKVIIWGNIIKIMRTTPIERRKDQLYLRKEGILQPVMPQVMYIIPPKGGVKEPIAMFMMIMIPKATMFTP